MNGSNKRIAVIGLYNSGSSIIAGMLHRLGVNMGPPFWTNSQENDHRNFYESYFLNLQLRKSWTEPDLIEINSSAHRIAFFKQCAAIQESSSASPIGAKHPLLTLCVADLVAAWGPDVHFIWAWRSFDESAAALLRRGWFPANKVIPLQTRLWNALIDLNSSEHQLTKLYWDQIKSNPLLAAQQLASVAGLNPTEDQLQYAASFVRTSRPTESRLAA